jgi:transcriptional regulator with XRE-family HTH domain
MNDKFDAVRLGQKLMNLRESLDMTQTQFGKACKTPAPRISQYEQGKLTPRVLSLRAICIATGASMDELLEIPKREET